MKLVLQPVNLDDIAEQAIADLKHQVDGSEKVVKIEKMTQPNLPRVLAGPDRIRRVLNNLLDNAYQYNLPDGQFGSGLIKSAKKCRSMSKIVVWASR